MDSFAVVLDQHRSAFSSLLRSVLRGVRADSDFADEARAAALDGLWEAHRRYDPGRGTDFWGYAQRLVRGRVQDLMRSRDPLSRRARQLVSSEGEEALVPWYLRARESVEGCEYSFASDGDPEEALAASEAGRRFERILGLVDSRKAEVLRRVLAHDEGYRSVALDLGVSECRVGQVYREALAVLRQEVCRCGEVLARGVCPACGSRGVRPHTSYRESGGRRVVQLTCGDRTLTLRQWSAETGVSVQTLRNRIRRGWRPEDVVASRHPGARALVELGGVKATVREWAARRGLCYDTVLSRLWAGWPLGEALSVPPRSRRHSLVRAA